MYWAAAQCDKLPRPLSAAHFDAAVNAGPKQAAKLLQRALHVADDGIIGPGTLAAAKAADPVSAADADCDARLAFYNALVKNKPTLGAFLKGWTRRVEALRVFCGAASPSFDAMEHAPEPTASLLHELESFIGL
jgi:lysozyme family protein